MRALVVLLASLVASAAAAQTETVVVGDTQIVGVEDVCHVPGFGPCETSARAGVTLTTGGAPAHVRVIALARADTRSRALVWRAIPVTSLQLDTETPVRGRAEIVVPAGGAHSLGVLHAALPMGRGLHYRITLEVDGERVIVFARQDVEVRHPLPE